MAVEATSAACSASPLLAPVTLLCSDPSPFKALFVMACFSDSDSSPAGVSVCHVSAEDVSLLYALHIVRKAPVSVALGNGRRHAVPARLCG